MCGQHKAANQYEFTNLFLYVSCCVNSPRAQSPYPHRNLLSKMLSIQPRFTFSEPDKFMKLTAKLKGAINSQQIGQHLSSISHTSLWLIQATF